MDRSNNIIVATIMDSHRKSDEEISAIIRDAIEGQFKEYNNEYCECLFYLFSNSMFSCIHKMEAFADVDDELKNELDTFYHECKDHVFDEGFCWPWKKLISFNRKFRKSQEKNTKASEQIKAEAEAHLLCFHDI